MTRLAEGVVEHVLFRQTVQAWVGDQITPCTVLCRRFEGSALDATYVDMWCSTPDDDFADLESYMILPHDGSDDATIIREVIDAFDGFIAAVSHPTPISTVTNTVGILMCDVHGDGGPKMQVGKTPS